MFAQNDNPISIHERVELPDEQLRVLAPSIFAAQAMPSVSSRYAFVPTSQLVSRLRDAGWAPVSAVQQRVKLDERRGFQKHLIRFQRRDVVPVKGEYTPELCLINSHDRSSAYQLHAGLYRFICANGMFVGDGDAFERVSIRHAGFTPDEVIDASFRILDQVPAITASVESFRARRLTDAESSAFAAAALRLRYDDPHTAPVGPEKLLEARRYEDAGDNLWNVLNRLQENLCRGGLQDESRQAGQRKAVCTHAGNHRPRPQRQAQQGALEPHTTSGQRRTVEFRRVANTGRSLPRERPSFRLP